MSNKLELAFCEMDQWRVKYQNLEKFSHLNKFDENGRNKDFNNKINLLNSEISRLNFLNSEKNNQNIELKKRVFNLF